MDGIIISLGSNLGDRYGYLSRARDLIMRDVGPISAASSIIETPSWGFDSFAFLNQVIRVETTLTPHQLLDKLQAIERELGRTTKRASVYDTTSYTDRTIDLDILYYNDVTLDDPLLSIPHPKIAERTFFHPLLREINAHVPEGDTQPQTDTSFMMNYNYIVVEGCIGAGKTSLAERFARDFNSELILERFVDNNFLPKFYKDPVHYAFPVEMTFLTDRYQQLKTLLSQRDLFTNSVVADYFIDKCIIFAKNNLQSDEYNLYTKVYDIISTYLPRPDIILYLYNNTDRLLQNIAKRGRDFEQEITADYLGSIQDSYMTYLNRYTTIPVLIVEAHNLDFVHNEADYLILKDLLSKTYKNGINRITF